MAFAGAVGRVTIVNSQMPLSVHMTLEIPSSPVEHQPWCLARCDVTAIFSIALDRGSTVGPSHLGSITHKRHWDTASGTEATQKAIEKIKKGRFGPV